MILCRCSEQLLIKLSTGAMLYFFRWDRTCGLHGAGGDGADGDGADRDGAWDGDGEGGDGDNDGAVLVFGWCPSGLHQGKQFLRTSQ